MPSKSAVATAPIVMVIFTIAGITAVSLISHDVGVITSTSSILVALTLAVWDRHVKQVELVAKQDSTEKKIDVNTQITEKASADAGTAVIKAAAVAETVAATATATAAMAATTAAIAEQTTGLRRQINSRLSELLDEVRRSALAEGRLEGKNEAMAEAKIVFEAAETARKKIEVLPESVK